MKIWTTEDDWCWVAIVTIMVVYFRVVCALAVGHF